MAWEIEFTEEFRTWWNSLTEEQQEAVTARVGMLEEQGPSLGRPTVAEVDGSTIPNLKELRASKDGALRVLFAFNPLRTAILLLGGDKATSGWKAWYGTAIPEAERLWDEHLSELRREGLI